MGGLYLLSARASQRLFQWDGKQAGYYNWLAQAFTDGHLYLPVIPEPELLALPNPWDPLRNGPYMARDLVLYHGRYYLYHGPTPAWLLFVPYRFLTHRDLPETLAAYLFCLLGYLACCGVLMRMWSTNGIRPGLFLYVALLLAMGICNCAPYLLARVSVYEVALAGGFSCVSCGFYFLARALTGPRRSAASLALAGMMLGLAVGCRPPLAFAGLIAGGILLWCLLPERASAAEATRELLAYILPFGACLLILAGYNYVRFGDPFEFGLRYIMAASNYYGFSPSLRNLAPGLHYLLLCPPDFDRVFPFIRLAARMYHPGAAFLPPRYFLEPTAGIFTIWPLAVVALAAPVVAAQGRNRAVRALATGLCLFAAGSIVFVASLGIVTQRYHADWLPSLVLLTCFVLGMPGLATRRPVSRGVSVLCAAALLYSVAASIAIAFQGPYDLFVQAHPSTYVELAGWFSPVARFRPLLDPSLTVEVTCDFPGTAGSGRLPLVAAGHNGSRYILWAEMLSATRVRITSATAPIWGSMVSAEADLIPDVPNRVRLDYQPQGREVTVQWNGVTVLRHKIPFLVTAPAQITAGEDHAEAYDWPSSSPGRVSVVNIFVNGVRRP